MESLSAYARQFLGQMDKPDVDSIEGLSPAISIDQKTTSRNPRSTVGTVTEIYDYLRLLWARIGKPHCFNCGRPIAAQSAEQIIDQLMALEEGTRFMVIAPIVRGRKGEFRKQLAELRAEGFTRVKVDGELRQLEEEIVLDKKYKHDVSVVVDRLVMRPDLRKRLADSVETASRWPTASSRSRASHTGAPSTRTPSASPACTAVSRCPSLSRARSRSTRPMAPARAAPAWVDDGDRPGAGGAGPVAVDRRRRDPAVVLGRPLYYEQSPRSPSAPGRRGHAVGGPDGEDRDLFLYGTNDDKLYVSYRNRMGRKRLDMTTFEGMRAQP